MLQERIDGRRRTLTALGVLALLLVSPTAVRADTPTPTSTPTAGVTVEPTSRPTATETPEPPSVAPRNTPSAQPTSRSKRHHRPHPDRAGATSTATPLGHHGKVGHKGKHKHAHRHKPTATPKPTKTPAINLQAEDSVAPVTCNGARRANAKRPFLYPPYRGWTSIVSYFDHDMPNFEVDGVMQTASGASAVAASHVASGFPAYWSSSLRQFLYYDGHNGYDFNLWFQPVYAAAAGKVIFAAFEYPDLPDHGYGKMVMIEHGNGYVTLYGHFSRLMVKKGQRIKRGEEIGISGNTGHSSGPHLHFTVFHNCSPSDPYGWSGSGDDPLQDFQGETSEFLWKRTPLAANPLPRWPYLEQLPAGSVTRIALLKLPATGNGTRYFTRHLEREVKRDEASLRKRGLFVKPDVLKGALTVSGTSTAQQIYALRDVVSITTPDTEEGEGSDVLSALARAALVTKHRRLSVGRSSVWRGYLLRWQHRTFLVGRGAKAGDVNLRLDENGKRVAVHHLRGDRKTGAFAADLGDLSKQQTVNLTRELEGKGTGGSSIIPREKTPSVHPVRRTPNRAWPTALISLLLLAVAGGTVGYRPARAALHRRRQAT